MNGPHLSKGKSIKKNVVQYTHDYDFFFGVHVEILRS